MRLLSAVPVFVCVLAVGGCADNAAPPDSAGVTVPDGFEVAVVVDDLVGPTQIAADGDGGFVVAELNGAEGEGTGRVLRYRQLATGEGEVLVDGLLTPTGVAVDGELLWIMERRRLTVGPLDRPDDRTVVLDDLPFNGRSEGTITAVAGGGILFDTSGARVGDQLMDGSGTLWYLAEPGAEPEEFATGFKHAYAHTPAEDDRWFVTEISDGTLDGRPPPDELVIAERGDDFGYPRCIGDGDPVAEFDVPESECDARARSHALLGPRSTPTSVAVSPWGDDVLVARWSAGDVVVVPVATDGSPHAPEPFLTGVEHPQHLLVDGERVLLTDHSGGRVLSVEPTD